MEWEKFAALMLGTLVLSLGLGAVNYVAGMLFGVICGMMSGFLYMSGALR